MTKELTVLENEIISLKKFDINAVVAGDPIKDEVRHVWDLKSQKRDLKRQLDNYLNNEERLRNEVAKLAVISHSKLRNFELANLTRLGILKEEYQTYAGTQTLEIPNNPNQSHLNVEFDADVYLDTQIYITELGELFIIACSEKKS